MNFLSYLVSMILAVPLSLFLGFLTILGSAIIVVSYYTVGKPKCIPVHDWVMDNWHKILLKLARVKLTIIGQKNIPDVGCLYVFNHQSLYDIPVCFAVTLKPIRFGAKIELFSIPVFGQAMTAYGALKIDRTHRETAIQTLNQAISRFKNGEQFILAAEGTRQSKQEIGEFKSGPFILAIQAQVPIVPVVLYGTHKIIPKGEWFVNLNIDKHVVAEILPPISTLGRTVDDKDEIKDKVRDMFVATYQKYKNQDDAAVQMNS